MATASSTLSAAERYALEAAVIERQLIELKEKLAAHKKRQAADPRNWGYAGDLAHVATKLDELLPALGG
jgi:hypothetical protein